MSRASEPTVASVAVDAAAALDERLLAEHVPAIRGYLRKILRRDEIEDGVQTVVTRALEGRAKYRGESSPRVWLLGIARYVGYELARSRKRHAVAADAPLDTAEVVDEVVGFAPTQEELIGRHQDQMLTLMALDELTLDDKLALLVTYADNLPGPEAAEMLGVSFAAFRQRLSRARQALAKAIERVAASGQPMNPQVVAAWQALFNPQVSARAFRDGGQTADLVPSPDAPSPITALTAAVRGAGVDVTPDEAPAPTPASARARAPSGAPRGKRGR
jgi:RNA polymerase sigma-70 factor (ECF subfamily)